MMKGEKINKDNYEVFYLDYLEGNLSGEDLVAFEIFLANNPNLNIDEELPSVALESAELDPSFKNSLKVFSEEESLNGESIERWLIAREERLLTYSQEKELVAFLNKNPHHNPLSLRYKQTHVIADTSIVFPHKAKLKKGARVIPLFALSSAIAACAVLAILAYPFLFSEDQGSYQKQGLAMTKPSEKPSGEDLDFSRFTAEKNKTKPLVQKRVPVNQIKTRQIPSFELQANLDEFQVLPERATKTYAQTSVNNNSENATEMESPSYAMGMKNPVAPLTRRVSSFIKAPVEVKTGKDQVHQRKGFYLRIGNFEFYRSKKDKTSEE